MSLYKCGFDDGLPEYESWKNDISCQLVGCKDCTHYNGIIYFKSNIKKGMSMWANKELENMD